MKLWNNDFPPLIAQVLLAHGEEMLPLIRTGDCHGDHMRELTSAPPLALFPSAKYPAAALSGLLLLTGCWEHSHEMSQELSSAEGSYWHAIAHRTEPDSANAAYWFRKVGKHAIYPQLHATASVILQAENVPNWRLRNDWDPFLFIEWCDQARSNPGGAEERVARTIQQAEWDLLFNWCAKGQCGPLSDDTSSADSDV